MLVFLLSSCGKNIERNSRINFVNLLGIHAQVNSLEPLVIGNKNFIKHSNMSVYIDRIPSNINSLKKGHYVSAIYFEDNNSAFILSLDIEHVLIGPISAVFGSKIIVIGQEVDITNLLNQNIFTPVVGRWIAISGKRLPNSEIVATGIEYLPSQAAGLIRGNVAFANSTRIKIGSANFSVTTSLPPILPGDPVLVRFIVKDSNFRALGVESLAGNLFNREVQSAILEDFIVLGDDNYPRLMSNNYIVDGFKNVISGDYVLAKGIFVPGRTFKVEKLIKLNE